MDQLFTRVFSSMTSAELHRHLQEMRPAAPVEPERFLGKWYNIEAFPQSFDANCTDSMAIYTPKAKNTFNIHNSCLYKGKPYDAQGTAVVAAGDDHSQLIVNFLFHGFSTFFSSVNLCIIKAVGSDKTKTADQQYEYAMMGTPQLDGLWFMSRTPNPLPEATERDFRETATRLGFDLSRLTAISQQNNLAVSLPKAATSVPRKSKSAAG
jgi:apolipoprotein D and lipocalin family protein